MKTLGWVFVGVVIGVSSVYLLQRRGPATPAYNPVVDSLRIQILALEEIADNAIRISVKSKIESDEYKKQAQFNEKKANEYRKEIKRINKIKLGNIDTLLMRIFPNDSANRLEEIYDSLRGSQDSASIKIDKQIGLNERIPQGGNGITRNVLYSVRDSIQSAIRSFELSTGDYKGKGIENKRSLHGGGKAEKKIPLSFYYWRGRNRTVNLEINLKG